MRRDLVSREPSKRFSVSETVRPDPLVREPPFPASPLAAEIIVIALEQSIEKLLPWTEFADNR